MMMKINQTLKKQRGIGLLELMLSLAIIAILLVMATRYYVVSSRSESVNRLVTLIGALKGAIASYNGPLSTSSNIATDLINIGAVADADLNADKNGVISQYGPVTFTGATDGVTFTLTNLPQDVCNALVNRFTGDNTVMGSCGSETGSSVTVTVSHQ